MNRTDLIDLLEGVRAGDVPVDEAAEQLRRLPFQHIGDFARLDTHRALRCGFPEVILGQGKTPEQVTQILLRQAEHPVPHLVTRADPDIYERVKSELPDAVYHPRSRVITLNRAPIPEPLPGILVVTGGTSDIPVAEEAVLTAELMGNQVKCLYDVGVAGLHRLLEETDELQKARVLIVVAGMEGALASVVGGLVSAPVIAVPTSIGYGASFQGLAALLAMLNSCASGVAVVNIDNGFGAGYLAGLINRMASS
jgi:NCAIR mutase (PurE)-related protein